MGNTGVIAKPMKCQYVKMSSRNNLLQADPVIQAIFHSFLFALAGLEITVKA
jgi:hypothetical protein